MCVLTCLILNRPFNISQAIFKYMVDNIHGEKFLQYPRFIQMILDDKVKSLPKVDADELLLDHMDAETLKRLNVKQFDAILKPDYVALGHNQWRHDDSISDSETKKMEPFYNKRGNFRLKGEDKKRKRNVTPKALKPATPKHAPKKASKKKYLPHLVDEPATPPDFVNVEGEGTTGGESVKETFVEDVVHTDSSATDLDIHVTQVAPTHYVSGIYKLKGPSRKRKGSDEDDAPYVPTDAEAGKVKKGRGIKRSAKPIDATPRKSKVQKILIKPLKEKACDSSKAPEKVT
ncbi:hypothetical protein Hanom_Chr10g00912511 [Helianthus anomalus]